MKRKLLVFCLGGLSSCGNKAKEVVADGETNTAAAVVVDEEIAEPVNEPALEPDANEGEIWIQISGTYPYSDGTNNIMVSANPGDEITLDINDVTYPATINSETGLITAKDKQGKVIFEGYMYNGAAVLKGRLNGNPVRLEGMFGL